ncbi:MAG: PAS domain S-box protein [Magnetococcales bacterium]|nr:PAS domain S-box protein [Magnetococcales bacterium]
MKNDLQEVFVPISDRQLDRIVTAMASAMTARDGLQEILDVMVNALIVLDGAGAIRMVNQAASELLGQERRVLSGMHVKGLLAEGEPWLEACMETVAHQGSIRNLESWLRHAIGHRIPVLLSVSALRNREGGIEGYVCAAQDISEQHRLQDALRCSMASFQSIVEKSADGILVLGEEARVAYLNESATLLLGRGAEEVLGLPFGFPVVSGNVTEVDIIRKNGDLGIAEMRTVTTRWEDRNALLVSLRDVTETVRLREQLRQLSMEDELTGLHNRRGFMLLAQQELRLIERGNAGF